jgi:hypothetical protein
MLPDQDRINQALKSWKRITTISPSYLSRQDRLNVAALQARSDLTSF